MYIVTEKIEYIYQLLRNFEYWKVIRITSWIYRFLENCKRNEKFSDSVKTSETEKEKYSGLSMSKDKLKQQTTLKKINVD